MEFHCLDYPFSAVRHIRILLLWTLKRWLFVVMSFVIHVSLHGIFANISMDHFSLVRNIFGILRNEDGLFLWANSQFLNPNYCREYVRERLGLAHRQYLCDKKYCNWGPQFWRICSTMICARLSESSMPVWLTHEIAQVAQLFERAI